jgi:Ca2+-binding RTX toxin-like protein
MEARMVSYGTYQPVFYITPKTYYGNWWDDTIHGNSIVSNTIWGYGGNDWLYGNVGEDWLFGDAGDDHLFGGDGNDNISGSYGDDWIQGDAGNDWLNGEDGGDSMFGGSGDDQISGGAGNDSIHSDSGVDQIYGEAGDDFLFLDGDYGSHAYGGDGNDIIRAFGGSAGEYGGAGNDALFGGDGQDTLTGDDGDDELHGGKNDDVLDAGTGHDTLHGDEGNDIMNLGPDGTTANGDAGDDTFLLALADINSKFAIDGGDGHDTVELRHLGGGALDLPLNAISQRADSIEALNFDYLYPKTDLHLKAGDVLDFNTGGELKIDGNSNQTLHLEGGWKDAGPDGAYHDYVAAAGNQIVTVHVDTDIPVVIA